MLDNQYLLHGLNALCRAHEFNYFQDGHWTGRGGDLSLGHKLKYPYGFYGLMNKAGDPEIKKRCFEVAYRIF